MSGYERLRERLPSLYRPEVEDETLLNRWLTATGIVIDDAENQVQHVLRGHWFDSADKATWDNHYQNDRRTRELPPVNVRDPKDAKELRLYPYITDLAKLCALLNLPPWNEPTNLKETTEEYRGRVDDLLAAYRLGLTTVPALRRLVEAALPEDMAAPAAQRRWSFAIEEPISLKSDLKAITAPGVQEGDVLSPLYRWRLETPHTPTLYIQGTAPDETLAATEHPAIERYTPGRVPTGIALAYRGTVTAGQTLRLTPARRSWLVRENTLYVCPLETSSNAANDPSANGPWTEVYPAPTGDIRLVVEAVDHTLWCAVEENGTWSLYRYDGRQFSIIPQGVTATTILCLHSHGAHIYMGTDQGLYRCPLFPNETQSYAMETVPGVPESIMAFTDLPDGRLACAGGNGLAILDTQGDLHNRLLSGIPLKTVYARREQLYLATEEALLLFDQDLWFRYEGATLSEEQLDWQPIEPGDIGTAQSPLPSVQDVAFSRDGSLWIATEHGLARYYAREGRSTILEAYPDIGTGRFHSLTLDDRGMLWVAGDGGLFRFDGRDLAQYDFGKNGWSKRGLAEAIYPDEMSETPRGHWRYDREQTRWKRYDSRLNRYADITMNPRNHNSDKVRAILFTESVRAELGQFDGSRFTSSEDVAHTQLTLRVKPTEARIVDGGLPAMPSYRSGAQWRYLQLEPSPLNVPPKGRPWWSREGRLFPLPWESGPVPDHVYDKSGPMPGHFPGKSGPVPDHFYDKSGPLPDHFHDKSEPLPGHLPDKNGPLPGHFRGKNKRGAADGHFDNAIFAYPPSARLWMAYPLPPKIGVRIRLFKSSPGQCIDPALVERVWALLGRAKAAAVPLELAIEGSMVKGDHA